MYKSTIFGIFNCHVPIKKKYVRAKRNTFAIKNVYLSEEALRKVTKDELVNLPLEYQNKFTSTLASVNSNIGDLRKILKKLRQI